MGLLLYSYELQRISVGAVHYYFLYITLRGVGLVRHYVPTSDFAV